MPNEQSQTTREFWQSVLTDKMHRSASLIRIWQIADSHRPASPDASPGEHKAPFAFSSLAQATERAIRPPLLPANRTSSIVVRGCCHPSRRCILPRGLRRTLLRTRRLLAHAQSPHSLPRPKIGPSRSFIYFGFAKVIVSNLQLSTLKIQCLSAAIIKRFDAEAHLEPSTAELARPTPTDSRESSLDSGARGMQES